MSFVLDGVAFVHNPKTAGTAMERALVGQNFGHQTAAELRRAHGEAFDAAFSFGFVRDPWNRYASAFYQYFVGPFHTRAGPETGVHFLPQHMFLCDARGEVLVDFVGRHEQLERDWAHVCERIGRDLPLEWVRRGRQGPDYRRHCTTAQRRVVAERYQRDIELFGYGEEGYDR